MKSKTNHSQDFFHTAVQENKHSPISPHEKNRHFVLVTDIGGTNSDFAVIEEKSHKLILSLHFHTREIIDFGKLMKKIVEYVGFSHKASVAMVRFCSESRLLTKEDLLPFTETKK